MKCTLSGELLKNDDIERAKRILLNMHYVIYAYEFATRVI